MIIGTAGGTAAKGSKTYKLSIPSAWMSELGINEERREVELAFDGEQIIISKSKTIQEFAKQKKAQGQDIRYYRYYDGDTLCTLIAADFTDKVLQAENYSKQLIKTAFGKNHLPSWLDFLNFLEERCIPRDRAGLREYLETIGVDEYDPIEIIQKTFGRMAEDGQWLEMEVLK